MHSFVQRLKRLLNLDRLCAVRIIEHNSNRRVPRIDDGSDPRVFLRDVVTVRCCVSPFNLNRVARYETIDLEGFFSATSFFRFLIEPVIDRNRSSPVRFSGTGRRWHRVISASSTLAAKHVSRLLSIASGKKEVVIERHDRWMKAAGY